MSFAFQKLAEASDNVILPHLAFVGRMGAGKSSAAARMTLFMYDKLSFAEKLREVAVKLYGPEAKNDRAILQSLGHGMRKIDPDIWVRPLVKQFRHSQGIRAGGNLPGLRAVVDDCRYANEAQALRELGFRFVRVDAHRNVRVSRLRASGKLTDEAQLDHETEQHADKIKCEFTITNNPGDDLDAQLIDIINKVAR